MTDVTQTLEIKASRVRLTGLVILGLIMTAVCFATAWRVFPNVAPGSLIEFVGWFGTIFFAACTLSFIWRIVRPDGLSLTLSPKGFRHSAVSKEIVPWTEIEGLSSWKYRGSKVLVVKVPESTWQSRELSRTARWSRSANQKLGVDGLAISPTGLTVGFDQLAALFYAYASAHGGKLD